MSDVVALCYHGVSPDWPSPMAVTPTQLRDQVAHFLRRGYRPSTVADAVAEPGRRVLLVTFDDALRSVHRHGLPVLAELGAVATVYAPSRYIARGEPMAWPEVAAHLATEHAGELDGMTADELRELAGLGWEIGSHTCTHPWLTRISDAELAAELADSRSELQALLDLPCRTLAYPFGDHDARVVAATTAAGYEAAVTLPNRVPPWPARLGPVERATLPRIGIYRKDEALRFRLKVSPPLRRIRSSRAWDAVVAARRLAGAGRR